MKSKGKLVFIVSLLSQPRCIKRVKAFFDDDYDCYVYGYDRGNYDVNRYPDGISVTKLGRLRDGEYINKLIKMFKDVRNITNSYKYETVLFYAFGFAQAMFLKLLRKHYVYEISDIFYAYPKFRFVFPFLKLVDKWLIRSSEITVMTSGGFYNFYDLKNSNIVVIPNKVSPMLNRQAVKPLISPLETINFGFVGAIRYETIFRFAEVIGKFFPHYTFHFYGGTTLDIYNQRLNKMQMEYSNIFIHGKFQNPSDLYAIYNTIDVVVACYDIASVNERFAEPNKLYEALFFCKPILVSDGIYLSERVKELECGYCIDASSELKIKLFINKLDKQDLVKISNRDYLLIDNEFVSNQQLLNDRVLLFYK